MKAIKLLIKLLQLIINAIVFIVSAIYLIVATGIFLFQLAFALLIIVWGFLHFGFIGGIIFTIALIAYINFVCKDEEDCERLARIYWANKYLT